MDKDGKVTAKYPIARGINAAPEHPSALPDQLPGVGEFSTAGHHIQQALRGYNRPNL